MWKVDQILALFAPFDCLGCGQEGRLLCLSCCSAKLPDRPNQCYRCLKVSRRPLCLPCRPKAGLDGVWVSSNYQGVTSQLIIRLKFSRTQAAAAIIAEIMASQSPVLPEDTVVVHVPTANSRVRQRGYDQAQLIAKALAGRQQLPYQALLRRRGKTRQVGANRQERLAQLQQAYYCPRPSLVVGRKILLVDDVLTTGATIETAARVLRQNGAKSVRAALFAQKI